jgi:hypothetical protein
LSLFVSSINGSPYSGGGGGGSVSSNLSISNLNTQTINSNSVGPAFGPYAVKVTSGSGSVSVPSGRNFVRVTMMGGGGGGGGGGAGGYGGGMDNNCGGGGGGGGGGQVVQFMFYTANNTISYSVGSGGTGSIWDLGSMMFSPQAEAGANTTINVTNSEVITAHGGQPGIDGNDYITSNAAGGPGGDSGSGAPSSTFSTITMNSVPGTAGNSPPNFITPGTGGVGGGNGGTGGTGGTGVESGLNPGCNGQTGGNGMIYFEFM